MANLERTYVIPLRREWLKAPKYKRAKKAIRAIKEFVQKHVKAEEENLRIGQALNKTIWHHGIKNPPGKVKVNVVKDEKGIAYVELFGVELKVKEEKKEKKLTEKISEKLTGSKEEKKTETPKKEVPKTEKPKEEAKKTVKPKEKKFDKSVVDDLLEPKNSVKKE